MQRRILLPLAIAVLMPFAAMAAGVQVIIDGQTVVFTDVAQSAWFATYVRGAAEAGIVNGYKDIYGNLTGKFGPSNNITIAEALKIAVEGAGYDEQEYALKIESDVDHWSAAYVSVAKSEGFLVIDARTRLDNAATRAEVAAMFTSAFEVETGTPMGNRYDDVEVNTEFAADIEALTEDGILSGDTDIHGQATGKFRPTDRINRAEVAKMVMEARAEYGTPGEGQEPEETEGGMQNEENVVTYTSTGFSPQVLRIQKGETVTFKNGTTSQMWVASDPHPTHGNLSAFDALDAKGQGEIYTYTFTQIGTWGYHNHMNVTHKGTIIVE